jgi:hypothetical protein
MEENSTEMKRYWKIQKIFLDKEFLIMVLIYGGFISPRKEDTRFVKLPKDELLKLKVGDEMPFSENHTYKISEYIDLSGDKNQSYWHLAPKITAKDFVPK